MVGLLDGVETFRIRITVYTQYRRVTEGQTDRRTDILPRHSPRYAYTSRGKIHNIFAHDFSLVYTQKSPDRML